MKTFFPVEPAFPEGFAYHPNFINMDEEQEFRHPIPNAELHSFNFHGYEAKRKVASYGYDWIFESDLCQREKKFLRLSIS